MSSAVLIGVILSCIPLSADETRAFPGAEGAGAFTRGGRGGKVIAVTNLANSGPGTLRAAIDAKGPRTVVFQIGGLIELSKPLEVREPFITIAGQSAPGDGICLKNFGFKVVASDVIVRHLRVRPGDVTKKEQDAISVGSVKRVILDHCSTSWGTDETLSIFGDCDDITVQWCLIAESLNNSIHHKGPHGYASLVGSDNGDITFHHNAFVSHNSRSPRPGSRKPENPGSRFEFVNNVVYNWGARSGYNDETRLSMNYVSNYLKPGPSTRKGSRCVFFQVGGIATRMFAAGNEIEGCPEATADNWSGVRNSETLSREQLLQTVRSSSPAVKSTIEAEPAADAFKRVLSEVGAINPRRDRVDERLVGEIPSGTGRIIDSQREVGAWPRYELGTTPTDSDGDGIPDEWETLHKLDPKDATDGNADSDGDGYTNLEEWLNATDPSKRD